MNETRRGVVLLIRQGDPEITEAIVEGIAAGRGKTPEALTEEQIEVVRAEIDRQRVLTNLVRVAAGNRHTAEDYRRMIARARVAYAVRRPNALTRRLWAVAGLVVLAAKAFIAWEERCWKGGAAS